MISKRGILFFVCLVALQLNGLLGQIKKYPDYEKKPVTYSEKITYRYILKHNRFNTIHEIDSSGVDTIFNTDGSVKSISKRYQQIISTADFQYPDSTLYAKEVYNEKGLLVYNEERYHIHVDQPCFTQTYLIYDDRNRQIQNDVFECDSFFYRQLKVEFDDKLRTVKENLFDKKHNYLEYSAEMKFDQSGRKEKILVTQEEDGKTVEWSRTEFSYEEGGAKVTRKIYDGNKLDNIYYWLYDRKGRLLSELDCHPPNDTRDTLVSHRVEFSYNRRGNLVKKKENYWQQNIVINYTYDRKNRLATEKYTSESKDFEEKETKKYWSRTEYHYRKDGLLDHEDIFVHDGEVIRYRYEYKFKP